MSSRRSNPNNLIAENRNAAFRLMELWAGNERAHRSLDLAGLESDVIAVPSGGDKGGDLSAVFSCSDNTGSRGFSRIASVTATPPAAWPGMSITFCINIRHSGHGGVAGGAE